jgi:uncharacterized protein
MLILSAILLTINIFVYSNQYKKDLLLSREAGDIENIVDDEGELTEDQEATLKKWEERLSTYNPDEEDLQEQIDILGKGSFWEIKKYEKEWVLSGHTKMFYSKVFIINLMIMILGMALIKSGILSGEKRKSTYILMIVIGYSIGFALTYIKTNLVYKNNFDLLSLDKYMIIRHVDRIAVACGHIGLICLFVKSGILNWLKTSLAAVGRMAFSNYILHSLICTIIFYGYGFGLFGRVNMAYQMVIVLAIWVLQMILSPIWLKYFYFGPLEWIWRTLTYWKRQPMRIKSN